MARFMSALLVSTCLSMGCSGQGPAPAAMAPDPGGSGRGSGGSRMMDGAAGSPGSTDGSRPEVARLPDAALESGAGTNAPEVSPDVSTDVSADLVPGPVRDGG